MIKKATLFIIFFIIGIFSKVNCQQIFTSSQSVFNRYMFNPAVAGTEYSPVLNLSYRQLWTGLKDAPMEELSSLHLTVTDDVGIGTKIYKVATGPLSETAIEGTYAYYFPLGFEDYKLSFGISGLLCQYSINKDKITLEDPNDNALLKSSSNLIVPDANFGTYMYDNKFFAGISIYQLFNRKVSMLNIDNLSQRQVRHYFLSAGYKYSMTNYFDIEPSINLKFIEAGIAQADINLMCTYWDMSFGMGYRTQDALIFLINTKFKTISFGYSYDITFSPIRKYSAGTHEISVIYKFKK